MLQAQRYSTSMNSTDLQIHGRGDIYISCSQEEGDGEGFQIALNASVKAYLMSKIDIQCRKIYNIILEEGQLRSLKLSKIGLSNL